MGAPGDRRLEVHPVMTETIDWLLHIGERYPALVAIFLGTAAGYALGLIAETYFIPEKMPARQQQGLTVLITIAGATAMCAAIWHGLARGNLELRIVASLAASLLAPFTYPAVARFMTARFPSIGTVWQLPGETPAPKPPSS